MSRKPVPQYTGAYPFKIEDLARYIQKKVWSQNVPQWWCVLKGSMRPWDYRIEAISRKSALEPETFYRIYDHTNKCIVRKASIYGVASYLAPLMLKAMKTT